jgi:hypothetical protein
MSVKNLLKKLHTLPFNPVIDLEGLKKVYAYSPNSPYKYRYHRLKKNGMHKRMRKAH